MSGTRISNATKTALIATVRQGQRVEPWYFEFIYRERNFCDEFIQAAEAAQNHQVLKDLKVFIQRESDKIISSNTLKKPTNQNQKNTPKKEPEKTKLKGQQLSLVQVKKASSINLADCPKCHEKLHKKLLPHHVCKQQQKNTVASPNTKSLISKRSSKRSNRRRIANPRTMFQSSGLNNYSLQITDSKEGKSLVYCKCGAPAIPGDTCCYDHKHN